MRIFLTGGTGYIGSAVLDAFVRAGHRVDALVRNSEKAALVQERGGNAVLGDASDPKTYADAAAAADGVVLTAFEESPRGVKIDESTIDTVLAGPVKPGRFIIYTSGVWVLGDTNGPATEDAPVKPTPHVAWRPAHEALVQSLSRSGQIRTAIVRPGIVYGGARGIISDLLKNAKNGLLRVVGDGRNHWPCVYDRDLADLYVRIAAHPEASGIFHANDEADERVSDIVEAIARHFMVQPDIRHVPIEEARNKMGQYADALALDQVVRSPRARALGWAPTLHSVAGNVAGLIEEFRSGQEAAA
jgi:nucleoside-diphosphate-sugar epimerase